GTSTDAFEWNGTDWVALRSASNVGITNVNDFIVYQGSLFAEANGRTSRWDGASWTTSNVGGSSDSGGLIEYGGRLHRFGDIWQSGIDGYNIRNWNGTGNWRGLGSLPDYRVPSISQSPMTLTCAAVHEGVLYLGGFVGRISGSVVNYGTPKGI